MVPEGTLLAPVFLSPLHSAPRTSTAMSNLADEVTPVDEDPLDAALGAWRHWVVAALLPAAIHRLNNGRYILMGLAEQMLSDGPSERAETHELLRSESERDRALTDLLSRLALPQREGRRAHSVEALCAAMEESLAGMHSIFRSVRSVCTPAMLELDARQLQVALVGLGVTFAQLSGLASTHRMSDGSRTPGDLAFRGGPEGIAVELTAEALPEQPASMPPLPLAEIEAHLRTLARAWSASLTMTFSSSVWRASFDFGPAPLPAAGEEPRAGAADSGGKARGSLLLVMDDASGAGLIETVLADCGYAIECTEHLGSDPGKLAEFDLVLWSIPPGDHSEQLRSLTRFGARVAVLGDAPGGVDCVPSLPAPPRPRELIAFVGEVLGS